MSERVGLDRSYLAEVETGKIEICLRNLEAIAQLFEIEIWQLLKIPTSRRSSR
jgi:transcriptional regulator with XRE-family HTH domain